METQIERCPWCDSEISHDQFEDITARIRQEEQAHFLVLKEQAEAEAKSRAEAEAMKQVKAAEVARDVAIAAVNKSAVEQLQNEQAAASKKIAAAEAARDEALAAKKANDEKLAAEVTAATKAAEEKSQRDQEAASKRIAAVETARDEALAANAAISAQLEAACAAAKKAAEDEAQKSQAIIQKRAEVAEAERDAAIAAQKASDAKSEAAVAAANAAAEDRLKKEYEQEMQIQRESLVKDHEKKLIQANGDKTREIDAFKARVRELQRQLENRTANEIGDGAQIDLFEELRGAFEGDKITQIKKGVAGADIRHEVVHNGKSCGTILYDSKARQQWRNEYVSKLREDQIAGEATHAVLSSTVFPRGKKELCLDSGIIIVNPCHAVHVATILRESLVRMHVLGLSSQQQESKIARLYEFMTSDSSGILLAELGNVNTEMQQLDVAEQAAHKNVWFKRGKLLIRQGHQLQSFCSQISGIIECTDYFEADDHAGHGPVETSAVAS